MDHRTKTNQQRGQFHYIMTERKYLFDKKWMATTSDTDQIQQIENSLCVHKYFWMFLSLSLMMFLVFTSLDCFHFTARCGNKNNRPQVNIIQTEQEKIYV